MTPGEIAKATGLSAKVIKESQQSAKEFSDQIQANLKQTDKIKKLERDDSQFRLMKGKPRVNRKAGEANIKKGPSTSTGTDGSEEFMTSAGSKGKDQ